MENSEINKKKWKPRPRYMGKVIRWNKDRKFGFIRCFEDGESYFAHVSQLTDDYELIRGSVVEFEIWTNKQEPDKNMQRRSLCVKYLKKSMENINGRTV